MTKHGSPELDADAEKLREQGADPGPTLADYPEGECVHQWLRTRVLGPDGVSVFYTCFKCGKETEVETRPYS